MKRSVVCDTETTGFHFKDGHRVIEIAAVEVIDGKVTGREFHVYINPERPVPPDSTMIHGLTDDFLADKPLFKEVLPEFLKFIEGAEFIAHNAGFDETFLNEEMMKAGSTKTLWEYVTKVVDTLDLSKRLYKTGKHSLDALLDRHAIDRSAREKHGALIDSQLLAEVYIEMIKGVNIEGPRLEDDIVRPPVVRVQKKGVLPVLHAAPLELQEHEAYLNGLEEQNKTQPVARRKAM